MKPLTTPDQFARMREMFHRGCDLSPALRAALLEESCGGDAELRAAAEDLFRADQGAGAGLGVIDCASFSDRLAPALLAAEPAAPESIGPYRVIRVLGEGGMGVAYLARQAFPEREVALKVLRSAWPSEGLRARFAREVRVLGRLAHPGIARVYDAGAVPTARGSLAYFAMEYVAGARITAYAREHALSVAARLELVARVADAAHHAHAKGVVHRDLKPSNILVRPGDPGAGERGAQPVILDFGVALVLDAGAQHTAITETGALIGTVGYMSPEQLSGEGDTDARSDVYALGAILYELLAGRPAYDLAGKPLAEAARVVRDEDPPSLREAARADGTRLDRDVVTVVGAAMAKQRERRYASAAALADDLRRYLRRERVLARPATVRYQVTKFASRHRALVASGVVAVVALLAGLGSSVALYVRAERERQAAVIKERAAAAVKAYLVDDLLKAAAPDRLGEGATMVRVLLDARGSVPERFAGQPDLQAEVHAAIAEALGVAGEVDACTGEWTRAVAMSDAAFGVDDERTIRVLLRQSASLTSAQQPLAAEAAAVEAVQRSRRAGGVGDDLLVDALMSAGRAKQNRTFFKDAIAVYREAIALGERDPQRHRARLDTLWGAMLDCESGRRGSDPGVVAALAERVRSRANDLPVDDPQRAVLLSEVMSALAGAGRQVEALAIAETLPDLLESSTAPSRRGYTYRRMAGVYQGLGMYERAERCGLLTVEAFAALFPHGNRQNEWAAGLMAGLYAQWPGKQAERVTWCERVAMYRMMLAGPGDGETVLSAVHTLGGAHADAADERSAGGCLEALWRRRDELVPRGHGRRAAFCANFAIASLALGYGEHVGEALADAEAALPDASIQRMAVGLVAMARERERPSGSGGAAR
jgi:serine/threonine protein kinase